MWSRKSTKDTDGRTSRKLFTPNSSRRSRSVSPQPTRPKTHLSALHSDHDGINSGGHPFEIHVDPSSASQGSLASVGSSGSRGAMTLKLFSTNLKSRVSLSKQNKMFDKIQSKLEALGYTKEELEEYRQLFSSMDKDNSGAIGVGELASAMFSMGLQPNQEELDSLFGEADTDGSGEIDFEEFCLSMKKMQTQKKNLTGDDITKQCFQVFDRNGDGLITESEFGYILKYLGDMEKETVSGRIFKEFDVDGNGLIGYEEFSHLVKYYMTEQDLESFQ